MVGVEAVQLEPGTPSCFHPVSSIIQRVPATGLARIRLQLRALRRALPGDQMQQPNDATLRELEVVLPGEPLLDLSARESFDGEPGGDGCQQPGTKATAPAPAGNDRWSRGDGPGCDSADSDEQSPDVR